MRNDSSKLILTVEQDIRDRTFRRVSCACLADLEVTEVPLLLPTWQVDALATAAQERGLTTAEMLRYLLRDFIDVLEGRRSFPAR